MLQFVQLLNVIPPSPLLLLRSKLLLSYISPEEVCPTVSAKIPSLPFPLYKICVINFTSLLSNSKRPRNVCFNILDITRINSFLSSTSSIIIFTSFSLRQAPAIPIIITTFINKYLSSGALFRNLFTSSLENTFDFFECCPTFFFFKKQSNLLKLPISIPLFCFIIVFSIENSDHKLTRLVSLLFLNTKYANIFFSLISTSCSFNHIAYTMKHVLTHTSI
ncbi:hypothetical protein C0J52_17337 [Blattella germanica]|nr:hypothetical protein C0J52_17337 [Blattella germanica]